MKKNAVMLGTLLAVAATGARAQSKDVVVTGSANVKVAVTFTPAMSIALGEAKNANVSFALNSAADYTTGIKVPVNNQLIVSSIGTEYAVSADVKPSKENPADLFNVLQFAVGAKLPKDLALSDLKPGKQVACNGGPALNQKLHAVYGVKPLNGTNLPTFNTLIGKDGKKSYTIDIAYTIAAK